MNDDTIKEPEESGGDEPTPVFQALQLTEWEYHTMKIIVAVEGCLARDFYAAAYASCVEKRKAWKPERPGERFPWLAKPKGGRRLSAATFEFQVAELQEWAEKDGVAVGNAYYTAIHNYILDRSESLGAEVEKTITT